MDVCILNSGFGSRLKKYTLKMPKALVPLNNQETLLGRQLRILENLKTFNYIITIGYLDGVIQEYVELNFQNLKVNYLFNKNYATSNYITSLDLLFDNYTEDLILLHGDLVFEKSVAIDVICSKESLVVIDSTVQLPEKDFKARVVNGKIIEIGVNVFGDNCFACQPFYHLTKKDWNIWQNAMRDFCNIGNISVYAEDALNSVLGKINLKPLDIKGRICNEVDDETDLKNIIEVLRKKDE